MKRTSVLVRSWFFVASVVLVVGCGGGGGDSSPQSAPTPIPATPTGVTATPGDGQAQISWSAVSGAMGYRVYRSSTSPVTTTSSVTNVTGANTTISSLSNGSPVFVAVAATNASGESALSAEVCAVPTAASTGGLRLYDPLCSATLDGSKWDTPASSRAVAKGAMVLTAQGSNMESVSVRGFSYMTRANVVTSGRRVTTLRANVLVPAASVSRSANGEVRASVRLQYQPPAAAGGDLDLLRFEIRLVDTGNGLRARRIIDHCTNASCSTTSTSGVAFMDPSGFTSGEATASYDTNYMLTVSLDEATGIFTWSIAGGGFGSGRTGLADPGLYLATSTNWVAAGPNPLASGGGFLTASLRVRASDASASGGANGAISAQFDDVYVGFDNAAPTLWDDFSGTGGNSGPTELSAAKWSPAGRSSIGMNAGGLVNDAQITSSSTAGVRFDQALFFKNAANINTFQADVTISACANNALNGTNMVVMAAHIYNDGTPGTAPPNQNAPNSLVGDILAVLRLDCPAGVAYFQIWRFDSTTPMLSTLLSSANSTVPIGPASVVGNVHTLRMQWDPVMRLLTFQADGQTPVVVNPTTVNTHMNVAAPYIRPPNWPNAYIENLLDVPSSPSAQGKTAALNFRLNNVFVAP